MTYCKCYHVTKHRSLHGWIINTKSNTGSFRAPPCKNDFWTLCMLSKDIVYLFNLTTLSKIVAYAALNSAMVMNDTLEGPWKESNLSISACTRRDLGEPWITSAKVLYPKDGGYMFLQSPRNHLPDYGITPVKNAVIIFLTLRTSNVIQSNQSRAE
jgi:hypothetical protein